jgi:hypothetical protein
LAVALCVGTWFARCGFGAFYGHAQIFETGEWLRLSTRLRRHTPFLVAAWRLVNMNSGIGR